MEGRQVVAQVVAVVTTALIVGWGQRESRRDWREQRRLPLLGGPHHLLNLLVAAAVVGLIGAAIFVMLRFDLLPLESLPATYLMVVWLTGALLFGIVGLTTRQLRKRAVGWVTAIGEDVLRIEGDGGVKTLKLRRRSARLLYIWATGRNFMPVQLELRDGDTEAQLWGWIGPGARKLVGWPYRYEKRGFLVGTSMTPLCRWLAPFIEGIKRPRPTSPHS